TPPYKYSDGGCREAKVIIILGPDASGKGEFRP
ncbi:unnamed protein product, partial [marine sediment metagenome]